MNLNVHEAQGCLNGNDHQNVFFQKDYDLNVHPHGNADQNMNVNA